MRHPKVTLMAEIPLRALVADDEEPALNELVYLLRRDDRIGEIRTASNGPEALKILQAADLDVVFCDIKMPGLDGIDLARVLSKFASRPQIVFVTAYDEHAVQAFELRGDRLRDEAGPGRAAGRGGPAGGHRRCTGVAAACR